MALPDNVPLDKNSMPYPLVYLQSLVDDAIKGLLRSIGDPGVTPTNVTGYTVLYLLRQIETFQSYIRSASYIGDKALDTSIPLSASATYTSPVWSGHQASVGYIEVALKTDQAGDLYVEQSWDGSNWDRSENDAIVAATELAVKKQLYYKNARFRIVNGGTDQTYLRAGHAWSFS